jgi:hypothetical protein
LKSEMYDYLGIRALEPPRSTLGLRRPKFGPSNNRYGHFDYIGAESMTVI